MKSTHRTGVAAIWVFAMAMFYLSVVPGSVGANELVANAQFPGFGLKEGFNIALAVGEAVGELKTVIGLDALDGNAFAGKMLVDFA